MVRHFTNHAAFTATFLICVWSFCNVVLEACVRYFLTVFFSPHYSPSKTMKNVFLFHLKSSFRSRNIQIFVFPSSPLFSLSVIALELDPR